MHVKPKLLTRLATESVLDVSLANVSVLRLDLADEFAPGNKRYKLQGYLQQAKQLGIRRLVSFGGPWSNHLHALAAVGQQEGLETVGLVRGEGHEAETATLQDLRRWGMRVERLSRQDYRRRNAPEFLSQVERRFAPCVLVPEGGAGEAAMSGVADIAELLEQYAIEGSRIVLPVGTGTTLAGIVRALNMSAQVAGISALKGAADLEQRITGMLPGSGRVSWQVLHDFHCGGFARVNQDLRDFMLAFEAVHPVPLEPVYTGKMMFAVYQLLKSGQWSSSQPIVAIHTGGLQGRRGYPWL